MITNIENQVWLLRDFLDNLISELNEEESWNMPLEPQDEGVLLDDIEEQARISHTQHNDRLPEPQYL